MDRRQITQVIVKYEDGAQEVYSEPGWHFRRLESEDRKKEGIWTWVRNEVVFKTGEKKVINPT